MGNALKKFCIQTDVKESPEIMIEEIKDAKTFEIIVIDDDEAKGDVAPSKEGEMGTRNVLKNFCIQTDVRESEINFENMVEEIKEVAKTFEIVIEDEGAEGDGAPSKEEELKESINQEQENEA